MTDIDWWHLKIIALDLFIIENPYNRLTLDVATIHKIINENMST